MKKNYKRVLTIAGSDSGGGAGIQADLKSFAACGCYGMSAITAITVQNTLGVTGVHPVPVQILQEQIRAVLNDLGADAVKIGMLHSAELIMAVKQELQACPVRSIVLDPVMVATSGDVLLQQDAIETLKKELIPCARVITPNIPEAEILLGRKIGGQEMLADSARELAAAGQVSVLLKAGHLTDDELIDVFYNAETDELLELSSKRLATPNTHGTGCTFSSAIAAFLAHGLPLNDAVRHAKDYLNGALVAGAEYVIGQGHGPVHHFYALWSE